MKGNKMDRSRNMSEADTLYFSEYTLEVINEVRDYIKKIDVLKPEDVFQVWFKCEYYWPSAIDFIQERFPDWKSQADMKELVLSHHL